MKSTADRLRQVELDCHFVSLKMLEDSNGDPVRAVVTNQGDVARSKLFWSEIFQDFPELRARFPEYADQFGPYQSAVPAPAPTFKPISEEDFETIRNQQRSQVAVPEQSREPNP